MEKITLPEANNSGSAEFSMALYLPSGCGGMTPGVSINYSSSGGNGSAGKGVSVNYGSVISIDTRHGLPQYNSEDTFIKDGVLLEKLTETSEYTEYTEYKSLRTNSFERIRHFTGSKNYWEVTQTDGRKLLYGKYETSLTELDEESCLQKSEGRIFCWYLTQETDVYGNTIYYEYYNDKNYVYPKEVTYTGTKDKKGNYSVHFNYITHEAENARVDIRSDYKSGSESLCRWLLKSIEIKYEESQIRAYSFEYIENEFNKEKMITALTVFNEDNSENYSYEFEYEGLKKDENEKTVFFAEQKQADNANPLGTTKGWSNRASVSTSGGVGWGCRYADLRVTGGVHGSVSKGKSYSDNIYCDINGDGRADSIKKDGNDYYAYLNISDGNGYTGFSSKEIKLGFINDEISKEENTTTTYGWNVYAGLGLRIKVIKAGVGASYAKTYQKTTSSIKNSFMDVDGDGLVDFVQSGKNYYYRNKGDESLSFEKRYFDGEGISIQENAPSGDELAGLKKTYYKQTPLRVWKAVNSGQVEIIESAKGINGFDEKSGMVSLGTYAKNWTQNFEAGTEKADVQYEKSIKNGDLIYFVADTGEECKNKDVEWEIKVQYKSVYPFERNFNAPVFFIDELIDEKIDKDQKYYEIPDGFSDVFFTQDNLPGKLWKYNPLWKENISKEEEKEVYALFIENNNFIPSVIPEDLFETLKEKVVEKAKTKDFPEKLESDDYEKKIKESLQYKYLTAFTSHFEKDSIHGLYVLKSFPEKKESDDEDDESDEEYYENLTTYEFYREYCIKDFLEELEEEGKWDSLFEPYSLYGKKYSLTENGVEYYDSFEKDFSDETSRSEDETGFVTGWSVKNESLQYEEKYINLGKIDGKVLTAFIKEWTEDILFETNDEINVLVTSGKSFFDSSTNLYQRSFLISCCHLSSQEIQQRKKFYTLEYFIKDKQKIEKLIRKEEKYLITST